MFFRQTVLVLGCIALVSACSSSSSSNSTPATVGNNSTSCTATSSSASFTVSGTALLMNGTIDCSTPGRLQAALANNTVTEVVLQNVPGSSDDEANLKAARMLRSRGTINTRVDENGLIASGGVDFFIAGIQRTVGKNARVAVHSWADGNGNQGITLYNSNPNSTEHQRYIQYYQDMGFTPVNAKDFYVYTLKAAPAEGTHCMNATELKQYQIVTNGQLDGSAALEPKTADNQSVCTH